MKKFQRVIAMSSSRSVAEMEVEIVSKEKIRPSVPTSSHQRTFKLSLLDQLIPAPYAPIILFYHPPPPITQSTTSSKYFLELLKTSLSECLTAFYPLAGKIKDDLSIDCNDEGALFVEARVKHSALDELLSRPDLNLLLNGFLPGELSSTTVTNIQVNVFKCGGMAIGLCISHKILDGAALSTFLKAWTSITARNLRMHTTSAAAADSSGAEDDVIVDLYGASNLFPTNDEVWLRDSSIVAWDSLFIKDSKSSCVTRRFVFDGTAIAILKDKVNKVNIKVEQQLLPNIIHHDHHSNQEDDDVDDQLMSPMSSSSSSSSSSISMASDRSTSDDSSSSSLSSVQVQHRPTRVGVVSAFIWQCAMAASKLMKYDGVQRPSLMSHAVNLRARTTAAKLSSSLMGFNLSGLENSIGNLLWIATAQSPPKESLMPPRHEHIMDINDEDEYSESETEIQLHGLVGELGNALSKIDGGYIKRMAGSEGKSLMLESLKELTSKASAEQQQGRDYYGFSSWCKLGFYQVGDFGWGKPAWVSSIASTGNSVFMNLIILVDTKSGDGIEAWVTLDQHHMSLLQANSHLQKLASVDPNPLLLS